MVTSARYLGPNRLLYQSSDRLAVFQRLFQFLSELGFNANRRDGGALHGASVSLL